MAGFGSDNNGARGESLTLRNSRSAPREARLFVRRVGADVPVVDDLELLVSELVTNAVVHTVGDLEVTIRVSDRRVRVEVDDTNVIPPPVRRPDGTGGRGLRLVESVASRWGVLRRGDGKTVWFEADAE